MDISEKLRREAKDALSILLGVEAGAHSALADRFVDCCIGCAVIVCSETMAEAMAEHINGQVAKRMSADSALYDSGCGEPELATDVDRECRNTKMSGGE